MLRAVWIILVIKELKDSAIQKVFEGNLEASLIAFIEEVEELRSKEHYQHRFCNEKCVARGKVCVFDSLEKICYPVCMISRYFIFM